MIFFTNQQGISFNQGCFKLLQITMLYKMCVLLLGVELGSVGVKSEDAVWYNFWQPS